MSHHSLVSDYTSEVIKCWTILCKSTWNRIMWPRGEISRWDKPTGTGGRAADQRIKQREKEESVDWSVIDHIITIPHNHQHFQTPSVPATSNPRCWKRRSTGARRLRVIFLFSFFFSITIQIYYCIITELLVAASRNRCFLYFNIWLAELSYDTRYLLLTLCGPHNSANWSHEWLAIFSPL